MPRASIAANINLDQLRPIFPLDLLTVHAIDDTSLGDDVRAVASGMNIAVQHDPEPARNLLRRSDQWPFLQAGIPATEDFNGGDNHGVSYFEVNQRNGWRWKKLPP